MLKRTLSVFLSLCIAMQTLPLTIFAEMFEGNLQKEIVQTVAPEEFEISNLNVQDGIVTVMSPEDRSAVVIVTQYKNGVVSCVNTAEADLIVGRNTIVIPDYERDDSATINVMLWDSMEKIHPLCEHLEIGAETFEVCFDTGDEKLTVSKRTYPSNSRFGKLPTPIVDDGLFVGWYYDEGCLEAVLQDDLVVDNCTLYAKIIKYADMYNDANDVFVERYVAKPDAKTTTKILVISDDSSMSKADVLNGITVENLSVFENSEESPDDENTQLLASEEDESEYEMEGFKVGKYTTENYPYNDVSNHEEKQQQWLENTDKAELFVFYVADGFAEGNSYRITLNDERLSFAGYATTARDYNLSVGKDEMSNLKLRDDIIFVNENLVNDAESDGTEAQLFGDNDGSSSGKAYNRFTLGSGQKLTLSQQVGGKFEIVTGSGNTGGAGNTEFTTDNILDAPEVLNNKIVAVYGHNDVENDNNTGEVASLFDEENSAFFENLTLDDSALWNLDYRTIEGQIDGEYVYTDSDSQNILFKPDVFPMLKSDVTERTVKGIKKQFISKEFINTDRTITEPVTNEEIKYSDIGVTDDTTLDVGDFIAFLITDENGNLACEYVKITDVADADDGYNVEYESATEEDIIASMDMYGERDLSAEELTGRTDFTELEEQAKLQAIESGFADNASMYVSTMVIASEAFADMSKEYELNCEEIRAEIAEAAKKFNEGTLLAEEGFLFSSKGGLVTIGKPDVTPNITPEISIGQDESGKEKFIAGITLNLIVSGAIYVSLGDTLNGTITIFYNIDFTQTLRAEVVMTAEATYRRVFGFIPVINSCVINSNIDFYTTTDIGLNITVGLTSEGGGSFDENASIYTNANQRVYVTPYGKCYHRKFCSYLDESKANNTLVSCTLAVATKSGNYRPCSRCHPGEFFADDLSEEIGDIVNMVQDIQDTMTNVMDTLQSFDAKLKEVREMLGDSVSKEAEDADAAIDEDSIPASLVAEQALIEKYQALLSNSYSEWAEIYRVSLFNANVFTFFGIINVNIGLDFCLYANLNLALSADMHYENAKRYVFTISIFDGEFKQSTFELVPEQFVFEFMAMGTAGIKAGIELSIGLNLICNNLAQISVNGEVGFYIKMWGYFRYYYKNVRPVGKPPETDTECHGALYFEAGPYVDIGFSASVLGGLNGLTEFSPTLYYQEFPIVTMGERKAVFGFANLDSDTEYRMRRNYNSIKLPADLFEVTYMDLRTGESGTISYADELKHAETKNNIYVSDHYTLTIINDDNDGAFKFDPNTASVIVDQDENDNHSVETAELIITYVLPKFAFNRSAITKKVRLYWDNYGEAHTIMFDSDGGSYVSPIIDNAGKSIQLSAPTRVGYIFKGWIPVEGWTLHEGEDHFNSEVMPENDVLLRADWEPGITTYTVNHWQYDLSGIPQLYETEILSEKTDNSVTPERKSYKGFKNSEFKLTDTVKGDGSTVIDYYYERNSYLYELVVQGLVTRRMVRYGTPIALTDRQIPGYEFNGWYDENGDLFGRPGSEDVLLFNFEFNQDLKLTADLKPLDTTPYTIDFYKYEQHDFTTESGETSIYHYDLLAQLKCRGVTDTEVDLDKIVRENPDAIDLVKIYEDNKDNDNFYVTSGYKLEEWEANLNLAPSSTKGTIKGDGSLVLRVYCEKANVKITYEGAMFEESNGNSKLVEVNKQIPIPEINPSKTGYTFGGWEYYYNDGENDMLAYSAKYTDSAENNWFLYDEQNGQLVKEILMPREPYSTKAIWIPNKYTVTLCDYDDNPIGSFEVTYGEPLPDNVEIPICEGYTFTGYYNGQTPYYDNSGNPIIEKYLIPDNVVLRPDRDAVVYDIKYILNDSKSVSKAINDSNDFSYTVENRVDFDKPTRTGYTFEGWYTTENFDKESLITSTEGYTGDLTVYAKWLPIEYTIEYTLNSPGDSYTWETLYTVEDKVIYEIPEREHYDFTGWYENGILTTGFDAGTIGDKKISGAMNPTVYIIEYNFNDTGSEAEVPNKDAYDIGYSVTDKVVFRIPSRPGYTFEGWYTTEDFDKESLITSTEGYTGDLTIYAKWNGPNDFAIHYELDGGENNIQNPNEYTIEDVEWNLYAPSRIGYTFNGWFSSTDGVKVKEQANGTEGEKIWIVTDNREPESKSAETILEFVAHWTENDYTVLYDVNKPTSSSDVKINRVETDSNGYYVDRVKYSEKFSLPTLTLTGYTFEGWFYDSNHSKFAGSSGKQLEKLTDKDGEKITLYAKWTENDYTVLYDVNKPTSSSAVSIDRVETDSNGYYVDRVKYSEEFSLPTPTLTGYTFEGWFYDSNHSKFAGKNDAVKSLTAEGTITLYAKWTPNTYKVSFNLNKPHKAESDIQWSGKEIAIWTYDQQYDVTHPKLTGWTFNGWTITGMDNNRHQIGDTTNSVESADGVKATAFKNLHATKGYTVEFTASWTLNEYTAEWSIPDKTSIKVCRVSSLKDGIAPGMLNSRDKVYYGDVLNITYGVSNGYFIKSCGDSSITVTRKITCDDIYVTPEAKKYTVTHNLNKPSNASNDIQWSGNTVAEWTFDKQGTLQNDPVLKGWKFDGWYYEGKCVGKGGTSLKNISETYKENVELSAEWKQIEYTIFFDPGYVDNSEAGVSTAIRTYTYDGKLNESYEHKRDGWKLVGWQLSDTKYLISDTSADSIKKLIDDNGLYKESCDIYLKAKWRGYEVTLEKQGGTGGIDSYYYLYNGSNTYYTDASCENAIKDNTISIPSKTGHAFSGYYMNPNGQGTQYVDYNGKCDYNDLCGSVERDITLYAYWSPAKKVTLDKRGGTGGTDNYYYFYNRTFKDANGTVIYYYKDASCQVNNAFTNYTIAIPSKSGYSFEGYYTDTEGKGTCYVNDRGECINNLFSGVANGITLYAYWIPSIKVTLDKQGGTGGTDNYYYLYNKDRQNASGTKIYYYKDSSCNINNGLSNSTITVPTKTGCVFGGYYTSTGGQGTQYIDANGNCINNLYASSNANVTLYAKWSYTITFNANGGSVSTSSKTVIYNSTYGTLPTPTWEYCNFVEWCKPGGLSVYSSSIVDSPQSHTLTARWAPNTTGYWSSGSRDKLVFSDGYTDYCQTGLNREALKSAGYLNFEIKIKINGKRMHWLYTPQWWFEIYSPSDIKVFDLGKADAWGTSWECREYTLTIGLDAIRDDGTIKVRYDHDLGGLGNNQTQETNNSFYLGTVEISTKATGRITPIN